MFYMITTASSIDHASILHPWDVGCEQEVVRENSRHRLPQQPSATFGTFVPHGYSCFQLHCFELHATYQLNISITIHV